MTRLKKTMKHHNSVVSREGGYKSKGARHGASVKRTHHAMPHKINDKITGRANSTAKNHA